MTIFGGAKLKIRTLSKPVILLVLLATYSIDAQERGLRVTGTDTKSLPSIHSIAIGVNNFPNIREIRLAGCVSDAMGFSYAIKPVAETNILLTDASANRKLILENFEKLLNAAQPGDVIIFYCATHGATQFNDFFLFPSDIERGKLLSTGFPFGVVTNAIASKEGIQTLIILDACQSGAIGFDITKFRGGSKSSILVAAGPSEYSIETKVNGRSQGFFTYFLTQGLRGKADENNDGYVTLREAFDYTYFNVKSATKGKQHPILIGTLENDLIMTTTKK